MNIENSIFNIWWLFLFSWAYYFDRYYHHKKSLELELKFVEKIKEQINKKLLNDAIKILWETREQIMLTYIFAYFVRSNEIEQLNRFEMAQHGLEGETENLSLHIQRGIKPMILNQTDDIKNLLEWV